MNTIDVKDLTIGCYLKDRHGRWLVVTEINQVSIECTYKNIPAMGRINFSIEDLRPIPIKQILLERLGLSKDTVRSWASFPVGDNGLSVDWTGEGYTLLRWSGGMGTKLTKQLSGLHHLQQLAWTTDRVFLTIQTTPTNA